MPLRVVFAGTPPFAATALEAIAAAGHSVPLVLTQPDRPAGRGMRMASSAVAQVAGRLGFALSKPASLRQGDAAAALEAARPDVMVVAAYGLILPPEILAIPAHGCLNIHASLLPRWRGAAPIQRALMAGDRETGVSIMQMDAGLDTGPVLLATPQPMGPRETTATLTESLARLGAQAIIEALDRIDALVPSPQANDAATYAPKIIKAEARIDWSRSSAEIDRAVRAFNPAPGAETSFRGETLKIWEAHAVSGSGKPGEVIDCDDARLVIACGSGALELHSVQKPGGRRLPVPEYLRGARIGRGAMMAGTAPD